MEKNNLFKNIKYCNCCSKVLDLTYKKDLCPKCEELEFFNVVKEYIRTNDVTEFDVADYFHIPRRQVRKWIREGRIEYADVNADRKLVGARCSICGNPVRCGTICKMCQKKAEKIISIKAERSDGKYRSTRNQT